MQGATTVINEAAKWPGVNFMFFCIGIAILIGCAIGLINYIKSQGN